MHDGAVKTMHVKAEAEWPCQENCMTTGQPCNREQAGDHDAGRRGSRSTAPVQTVVSCSPPSRTQSWDVDIIDGAQRDWRCGE